MTGTTTVGIAIKDGILLATESQATAGFHVATKVAQKLFQINQYAAATISGGVADCQYVIRQAEALSRLRAVKTGEPVDVEYVARVIRNLLFQGRSMFLSMMLVGGWDIQAQVPRLYGLDLLGTLMPEEKFMAFGSGSTYALGVVETEWKPGLTKAAGVKLVTKAITAARNRDAGSGYNIQVACVTKDGFEWVEKPDVLK